WMPIHFPPLTQDMQAHCEAVKDHIRMEIQKAGGLISFARFMELSLYAPGLGYYSAGCHKLGKSGDFITAPEISPLFGKCVAHQFADILQALPNGDILELGAGSGVFAKDVITELAQLKNLPSHYFILETSAELRRRQQELLKAECPYYFSKIVWLDRLPQAFHGIIFANEVLDALPTHCFQIQDKKVLERCVAIKDNDFTWTAKEPLTVELAHKAESIAKEFNLLDGYHSEINLLIPHWIASLANTLNQGVIIFFDYGYSRKEFYHHDRSNGTLRCYFQHRCHDDPFIFCGLQDITASVDFTSLVEDALDARLQLSGYTTQSAFLLATGIAQFAEAPPFSMQHYQQNQAMKLLMLPSEMGTAVKAVAFTKQWDNPLRGFSLFDKRHEL
ncbi:MAG TPA: SAM-dependent methyltransferase, partial [Gammaproteobacteria bacterium]|nr:SAM-dependent methyltransferase [Gammaproteobacteria bacterium]